MIRFALIFIGFVFIVGCQTPANIQQLESKNQVLQNKLNSNRQQTIKLKSERDKLRIELNEAQRVIDVIDDEKTARVKESTALRNQIRIFVQRQIDSLKAFLINSNLLDYVGGELVRRKKYDNRSMLLVDLKNITPRGGVLTGVGGYFVKPTKFTVKVFRKVNDKLVVIWESRPLLINKTGLVKKNFPVTVGVEKGDIIGYYFPKQATVSFDEGTADTRYIDQNLRPGHSIDLSSLSGESQKRAYSLGVYGLLK